MSRLKTVEGYMELLTENFSEDSDAPGEYYVCIYNNALGIPAYEGKLCAFKENHDETPCDICSAPSPKRLNLLLAGLRPVV